jgi:hypothetical protein
MAVVPDLKLRSSLGAGSMRTGSVPHDFGGAADYHPHPGQREPDDPSRILRTMCTRQMQPLDDVKVLKGTVYSFKNRRIIAKWIRDVCAAFSLRLTTFNLALQLCDAYTVKHLATLNVSHCQLVALAALWIASKFEEMDRAVPPLQNLVDVCDRAYTADEILATEEAILVNFKWLVPHTTATNFMFLYLHSVTSAASGAMIPAQVAAGDARVNGEDGTLRLLVCDSRTATTKIVVLRGLVPTKKLREEYNGTIAVAVGLPRNTPLDLFHAFGSGVVAALPLEDGATLADLQRRPAAGGDAPLVFAHGQSNSGASVFAQRGGVAMLRAPNEGVLQLAEVLLREALIHVEFLRVSPHVVGMAAVITAAAARCASAAEAAAVLRAVMRAVELQRAAHLKSSCLMMVDKYVEAAAADKALPALPDDMAARMDECILAVIPK